MQTEPNLPSYKRLPLFRYAEFDGEVVDVTVKLLKGK
jgi:hypothetical protein